jgi:hypothetical protein
VRDPHPGSGIGLDRQGRARAIAFGATARRRPSGIPPPGHDGAFVVLRHRPAIRVSAREPPRHQTPIAAPHRRRRTRASRRERLRDGEADPPSPSPASSREITSHASAMKAGASIAEPQTAELDEFRKSGPRSAPRAKRSFLHRVRVAARASVANAMTGSSCVAFGLPPPLLQLGVCAAGTSPWPSLPCSSRAVARETH